MKPIFVTQPSLPPLEDFLPMLQEIWDSKILTNGGPFHNQLEIALSNYLGVEHISLFANGTIAMVTALKALGVTGEVITTPYSFVATSHSISLNGLVPVFVDIDPVTLNLDPSKIEAAITPKTSAILPVHCYGGVCDMNAIDRIAKKYQLKVIYDAAHAFGVRSNSGNIFDHGDLSVLSFHATKVFNTFEGGAIISPDAETKKYIDQLKNFGYTSETTVVITGLNGKMNELQAAFGLLQLRSVDEFIDRRAKIAKRYRDAIQKINGLDFLYVDEQTKSNHSYFPIMVGDDYPLTRDELYEELKANGINGRRYFYPLITEFPMYSKMLSAQKGHLPNAEQAAAKVICLPIYPALSDEDQDRVINVLKLYR